MTNYNDGNWHAHNGGECPVHPETVLVAVAQDETCANCPVELFSSEKGIEAGEIPPQCWGRYEGYRSIIAFRVVEEHKEPREFTIRYNEDKSVTLIGSPVDHFFAKPGEIIHVREVTP